MSNEVTLKFNTGSGETNADILTHITVAVEELGRRERWPAPLVYKVNLILEELGLNSLTHGRNQQGDGELEITLASQRDTLTIELFDNGTPFDPIRDAPRPDLDAPLEERPIGGLGVHMVREIVDGATYQREGNRNHLTLIVSTADDSPRSDEPGSGQPTSG